MVEVEDYVSFRKADRGLFYPAEKYLLGGRRSYSEITLGLGKSPSVIHEEMSTLFQATVGFEGENPIAAK